MSKILLTQPLCGPGMELLAASDGVEVDIANSANPRDFYDKLEKAEAMIIRIGAMDRDAFEHAPNLKVIGRTGVGYDSIDIAAANDHGVPVVITPGAVEHSVAEHALTLFLALAKNLNELNARLRQGDWSVRGNGRIAEVAGKTAGFVGFGRTGRLTADLFHALGLSILAYDPFMPAGEISAAGAQPISDLDDRRLRLMKKGAFLINCSRGGIVDEQALADAVKGGVIAGAGVDVFSSEPPQGDNPLFGEENILVTPHVAGTTNESAAAAARMAIEGCLAVLAGKQYRPVANPEVYARSRWSK